ncbi:MAG TPA: hypothetical protein VLA99_12655 [Nitrospiraceae bacterium]|nr:hypothetical protein [Nitrospiraceae bacterium]
MSAASIWEATIKAGLGKVKADLPLLVEGIEASGFSELPVTAAHAAAVAQLWPLHRDPFDRPWSHRPSSSRSACSRQILCWWNTPTLLNSSKRD